MEEKKPEQKRTAPGTGEQYLFALIKCAGWVSKPYKQLAEKHRMNAEAVKELYLCACDGVPIEKAEEALTKNPPEGALRFLRHKHIESMTLGDYKEELSGIKQSTSTLEKEVRMMSETLTHIVNHVPNFDTMFPEGEQVEKPEAEKNEEPEQITVKITEKMVSQTQDKQPADVEQKQEREKGTILEFGMRKMQKWKRGAGQKKKSISEFVERCLKEGYSTEQMDYILDCLEAGAAIEDIERIASPNLPVDMMRRLRTLEERKEKNDGK